jgi:hypothetical protein
MRTVVGATTLAAGGLIWLDTVLVALTHPHAAGWLLAATGGLTAFLLLASFLLLRGKKGAPPGRWLIVVASSGAGLVGFILALVTAGSGIMARGDEMVDGKRVQSYELKVHLFGKVLYQEIGPAVEWTGKDGTYTGPSEGLETLMLAAGWSLAATYMVLFALLGAVLGAVIYRLAFLAKGG